MSERLSDEELQVLGDAIDAGIAAFRRPDGGVGIYRPTNPYERRHLPLDLPPDHPLMTSLVEDRNLK